MPQLLLFVASQRWQASIEGRWWLIQAGSHPKNSHLSLFVLCKAPSAQEELREIVEEENKLGGTSLPGSF